VKNGLSPLTVPENKSQILRQRAQGICPGGERAATASSLLPPSAAAHELALYRALVTGGIAGAALDVWYRYPTTAGPVVPATQLFHELGNVIMTPHVAGWTQGMLEARAKLIAENIERIARGEAPLNKIEPNA
jgi:D-isomer specific 2-hydroxyacid dehydrogenase, NAD binding domain